MLPTWFTKKKSPRILLVRPDVIGDVVLITPLINTIKKTWSNSEIYTLQQTYTSDLFQGHEAVKEVVIDWKKSGKANGILGFFKYARYLSSFNFDIVIQCYLEPYYALLMLAARIPIRIGDANKFLLRPYLNFPTPIQYRNIVLHEIEANIELLHYHYPNLRVSKEMDLYCDDNEQDHVNNVLMSLGWKEKGEGKKTGLIGIHPTTGGGNKPWSPKKYAELIDMIYEHTSYQVVLTGAGQRDEETNREIMSYATFKPMNVAGKTSLSQLKLLICSCMMFIGTDTGPLHIAAALSIPVLCISTTSFVKPSRWGPWHTSHLVLKNPHSCDSSCPSVGCPLLNSVDALSAQDVFEGISKLIKKEKRLSEKEDQLNWFKMSLNIGLYCSESDDRTLQRLLTQIQFFQSENIAFYVIVSSVSIKKRIQKYLGENQREVIPIVCYPLWFLFSLIRYIREHDIGLIYLFPEKKRWIWNIFIRQLSAPTMSCPPLIMNEEMNQEMNQEINKEADVQSVDRLYTTYVETITT